MVWLSVLKLFLDITSIIAKIVQDRQLMDAGAAKAILEYTNESSEKVKKAIAARNAVAADPDSVRDDPFDRSKDNSEE